MNRKQIYTVRENDNNRRIDRIIRKMLPDTGLSMIYKYIREGKILVNDKRIKQDYKVQINDKISIPIVLNPKTRDRTETGSKHQNSKSKIKIVFENENILAVNKPPELKIHGKESLNNIVSGYLFSKIKQSLSFKPGPAHRLDTNTTGLILFSKSLLGAQYLTYCFKNNCFNKYYLALADGKISEKKDWKDSIKKEKQTALIDNENKINAVTTVYPVSVKNNQSLIICKIDTGKYHQIRCQASYHGYPLTGDIKYKGSSLLKTYILHSIKLSVKNYNQTMNDLNHQFKSLEAPLPLKSERIIKNIFGEKAMDLIQRILKRI